MRSLLALLAFATLVSAQVEPDKALATMKAGDGLQVELFAAEPMLINPTNMDIDPLGRVWVTEAVNYRCHLKKKPINREAGDRIVILTDTDGDGKADTSTVFYQGKDLYGPLGICVIPQLFDKKLGYRVLVSQSPDILEFWDRDGDGKADGPPTKFLTGFGGYDHDHGVHSIQVGPDGKFYFTVGDQGFKDLKSSDGKQTFSQNRTTMQAGTVWRCDADGKNLEMLAHNFRNPYEACIDSFGEIWLSDNDDDGNQQTRICHVMPGGNYGYWPRGKGESHWHEEQPGIVHKTLRTGFGSPTGITCYEGTLLPEKFRGQLIHADAGPREIRCFHKKPKGAGYELDKTLMMTSTDNWFRPSDVCVAPDGSVFVADWYDPGVGGHGMGDTTRGRIYRITPAGHKGYKVPLVNMETNSGILAVLASPNPATLTMPLKHISAMNNVDRTNALVLAASPTQNPLLRARAAWIGGLIMKGGQRSLGGENLNAWFDIWLGLFQPDAVPASSTDQLSIMSMRAGNLLHGNSPDEAPEEKDPERRQMIEMAINKLANSQSSAFRRETVLNLQYTHPTNAKRAYYHFAKKYDGQDRFYLAALNIACGIDPARREAILADFDKHFPAWNDTVAELVFELRPKCYMTKLDALLKDASLSAKQKGRIVDILATEPGSDAGKTVLALLGSEVPAEVKAKALVNLRLFLPSKWSKLAGSKELGEAIKGLLGTAATVPVGLELIAAANVTSHVKEVAGFAGKNQPLAARQAAIRTLGQLKDLAASEALITLALPENADTVACIDALGKQSEVKSVMDFLQATMAGDASMAMKTAAVQALAGSKAGTAYLLGLQEKKKLPPELANEAGKLLRNSPFQGERNRALMLFPAAAKLDLSKLVPNELAKRQGNAEVGKAVFRASFKGDAQCMKCHKVHSEGGEIGPDLSAIGKKASREDLYNSILYPSKAIADQFVTWKVETDSGQAVSGLIVKESPTELVIRDANGKDYAFDPKMVEKKKTATSLMAEDIAKGLTEAELVDLVEYLFSLKE